MVAAEEKQLRRAADRRLGGVCGGLAAHLGVPPARLRLGWAVLTVLTALIPGVLVYLILWAALPVEPAS